MELYYEDLQSGFSCDVEPFTLSSEDITLFARQWDPQPFHLGEVPDAEIGQGQSASGLHTLSATMRQFVLADIFSGNIVLGAGFESVRFRLPVMAGDELHARAVLMARRSMRTRPHLGLLTWQVTTWRRDCIVLDLKVVNLIRLRPKDGQE